LISWQTLKTVRVMVDILADPKNREELIEVGGINQVPMLLIDGKPLYESDDIVQWFKDNM